MNAPNLYIGIMSGTSLDGIDVCLVDTRPQQFKVLATHFLAYPEQIKSALLTLHTPSHNELEYSQMVANDLATLYAQAVNALLTEQQLLPNQIAAIGCHGQTIRHRPVIDGKMGFTLQIGNAALLAELTHITVVADFRSRDIAAGGQGAPLVPAFHQAIFSHADYNRALVNIGGIANITYLPKANAKDSQILGFDSGPGNMLMDAWIKQHLQRNYDADGAWAATGTVLPALLSALLNDPYFTAPPPKSTGRDLFNDAWLATQLGNEQYAPQDVARTLLAFTAHTIYQAIQDHCSQTEEIYLCGGGARNTLLVDTLRGLFKHTPVHTTDTLHVGVDWVEAAAFAWLAQQTMTGQAGNLPSVTGAKGPRVLGAIYPA
ncbi:anhydro-N-acetylmuramic acid kinase [Methylotenera sp. N17]|uniref:anhydro-N-acetylmuramic acid kinase n=1 Tax=Methylotenera sp. N17 TaxID=1502761 RepID=UPI0006462A3B|nr:anhydro-N-acetylmuramic acid kinase [Methylotenera sp. N17]